MSAEIFTGYRNRIKKKYEKQSKQPLEPGSLEDTPTRRTTVTRTRKEDKALLGGRGSARRSRLPSVGHAFQRQRGRPETEMQRAAPGRPGLGKLRGGTARR